MKPKRLGVFFNARESNGGIFQYSVGVLHALGHIQRETGIEVVVFFDSPDLPHDACETYHFKLVFCGSTFSRICDPYVPQRIRTFAKAARLLSSQPFVEVDKPTSNKRLASMFKSHDIDLMLYPTHRAESFETGLPFIISIHDIQHRLQSEFPEVIKFGQWKRCEYVVKNAVNTALTILADSEVGKEDIANAYTVQPSKITILPYVPAPEYEKPASEDRVAEVRKKYNLPEHFAFFPAHFWPHKNHYRLIEAIDLLKRESGIEVQLVLVGHVQAQWGEFDRVMTLVRQRGLSKQVRYLRFIPFEDMPSMYHAARFLIFPTFFGPTNIPVLEAFAATCPVITSDVRGIREQVGDAALLVDPRSVKSIARGMQELWTDATRREALIRSGLCRVHRWNQQMFASRLGDIIIESLSKLEAMSRTV